MSSIGARRERVRIERLTRTRRTDGGYDTANTTFAEFWASIEPVAAREAEQAGRMHGAVTYLLIAHRVDGLTTDDSVVWLTKGNMRLNIKEVRTPPNRALDMEIVAQSGVIQ